MQEYVDKTLEVWKKDRRVKGGVKLIQKYDYQHVESKWIEEEIRVLKSTVYAGDKWELKLFDTYVTRVNIMSGKEFKERYDTPYYCSPSSESYWSN